MMTKQEFLNQLSQELKYLPREEMLNALNYYAEYFEDAGVENEQDVIAEIGTPKEVAMQIISDSALKNANQPTKTVKKGFSNIWVIVIAICSAPISIPIAIGVLAVLFCAIVTVASILFALLTGSVFIAIGGIFIIVIGFMLIPTSMSASILAIGVGLIIIGITILLFMFSLSLTRFVLYLIGKLFSKILNRRKKHEKIY